MNRKLIVPIITAVVVIAIITATVIVIMENSPNSGSPVGGGIGRLKIVDYHATPGEISPVLTIEFSKNLDKYTTVELLNSTYKSVGVWAPQFPNIGNKINITKITPPNLIGLYYVVVHWKENVILNTTINFQAPKIDVLSYHVEKTSSGNEVHVEYVNLTLREKGDSPYYFNRVSWQMENSRNQEIIPLEHFSVGVNKIVKINIGEYLSPGTHNLVVHFKFFDTTTLTATVEITL